MAIWLTTVGILAAGLAGGLCAGRRASFPSRWPVMRAASVQRLGELIWILGLATRDHGHGALVDDLKNLNWRLRLGIQFGCARRSLAASGSASRCSGRSPIRSWGER